MNCNFNAVFAVFKKDLRTSLPVFLIVLIQAVIIVLTGYLILVFNDNTDTWLYEARVSNLLNRNMAFAIGFSLITMLMISAMPWANEHEWNTFGFLRQFPVSAADTAKGKVLSVLFYTLVSASVYLILIVGIGGLFSRRFPEIPIRFYLVYSVLILHTVVWGLFWSPRCKSFFFAGFTSGLCTFLLPALYAVLYVWGLWVKVTPSELLDVLFYSAPLTLSVSIIVIPFAVKGMLQWFEPETKIEGETETKCRFANTKLCCDTLLPVKSPFTALLHQTLRQSKWIYLAGAAGSAVLFIICFASGIIGNDSGRPSSFIFVMFVFMGYISPLLFGTTFGKDQSGESYRFLIHCGAVPGQVWLSRMLPMSVIAAPLLFFPIYEFIRYGYLGLFFIELAMILLPLLVASLCSLFCFGKKTKSSGAAMSLTMGLAMTMNAGFVCLLGLATCGLSFAPVPLLFSAALLIASQIAAEYWLREQMDSRTIKFWLVSGVVFIAIASITAIASNISDPITMIEDAYFRN
ncbi:hypothetical protein FACS18942_07530 [Planctomycetales bacterium]|nr:hypothetical protein FACS18942_07530 [Planctomycetales bacterium]